MSPYATLGVRPGAGPEEIRAAYRRLAMALHPDRQWGADADARAHEQFCALTDAYRAALAAAATATARVTTAGPVPPQRTAPRASRGADAMAALAALPRRSSVPWSLAAQRAWALTVVPEAERHLRRAEDLAERAGALTRDDFTLATVRAMLALAFRGRTARRAAAVAPYVPAAYWMLEDALPGPVVARLRVAVRHG